MNEQQQIWFKDVMSLGFKSSVEEDTVFFDHHGYKWRITTLNLTPELYLNWDNETFFVELIRTNNECDILGRIPVTDLDHLKMVLQFFGKLPKVTAA